MWLWRPNMDPPNTPFNGKKYRCCCFLIPSSIGFKIYNFLFLALQIGTLCYLIWDAGKPNAERTAVSTWAYILTWMILTILGMVACKTRKPVYMQIYLIITTIIYVASLFFTAIALLKAFERYMQPRQNIGPAMIKMVENYKEIPELAWIGIDPKEHKRKEVEFVRQLYGDKEADPLAELAGPVAVLVGFLLVTLWQAQLTFSYYFYVRDRQLELEERTKLVLVDDDEENHLFDDQNMRNRAIEKEKNDDQMFIPPPPYEKL